MTEVKCALKVMGYAAARGLHGEGAPSESGKIEVAGVVAAIFSLFGSILGAGIGGGVGHRDIVVF